MGLFDFFGKRREKKKENGKRYAALIMEVRDWVYEDLENRAALVSIAAVTGTITDHGIARAERQWRFMMDEHDDFVQDEKAEG